MCDKLSNYFESFNSIQQAINNSNNNVIGKQRTSNPHNASLDQLKRKGANARIQGSSCSIMQK